ncbi:thermonuclease family protein, partial [bacterium]|nr:thermonuclease family protein [bacterium]
IGVDLIMGFAGTVLFYGWFVQGWLSKGKDESIGEEEQDIELATLIPELSISRIINYLRSNVLIAVALICALLSPFLCVGSGKILYTEVSESPAYVHEQSTDTSSLDIAGTQTPNIVIITSTTIPSTPTETITLTPIPLATITLDKEKAQVIEIVDGDTIKVSISGSEYSVRYIGIDTPEVQYDEWFGKEARDANVELVAGKEVLLEKDVSETDQYDRLLRYVYLFDGTFVNAELVRRGFAVAKAYPPDTKYQDLLEALEQEARDEGLGLWQMTSTPEPIATTTSGASVQIILVDKRAEYVDIQNIGNQIVSIDGWTLRSDKGDQDCVLSGSLAAGEVLRIWALAEDSDQEGYCCWFGSNIWNNSELDPAVLFDDAFNEIDRYP